jgi:hypothetical protein
MTAYYWVIFNVDTQSGRAASHSGVFYTLEDAFNVSATLPLVCGPRGGRHTSGRAFQRVVREMRFPMSALPQKDVADVIRTNIQGAYVASYLPGSAHAWRVPPAVVEPAGAYR